MLNFKDGKAIAQVKGGMYNKKIVFLDDTEQIKGFDKLIIRGIMMPVPNLDTREVSYIAGPSGSGKSTYASKIIENFHKLFPDNNIYIFSRLESDPVLDRLKPIRVTLDNSLIEDPIDVHSELQQGDLILFDDCDTLQDKKLKDAVSRLKNDILETGRHLNLYIIITSHLINGNDKKDTRTVLNEAHTITIFPKSGSTYGINYVLKNYIGLNKQQINKIISLPSRWVTIGKSYPQYVLYEKGIYLIN